MQRYVNKIAVVTGGNSGIGLAAAKLLKAEDARVVIVGRDRATLDAAAAEFDLVAVQADIGYVVGAELTIDGGMGQL